MGPPRHRFLSVLMLRVIVPVVAAFAAVAATNIVVDPYDITPIVTIPGVNDSKPRQLDRANLTKTRAIVRDRWDAVALGPSQIERSIDPDNPALEDHGIHLYNAGLSGEAPAEEAILLRRAAAPGTLKFAIVGLSFYLYMPRTKDPGKPGPSRLEPAGTYEAELEEDAALAVSPSQFAASIETIVNSFKRRRSLQHLKNGLLNVEPDFLPPDHRAAFDQADDAYLNLSETYRAILRAEPAPGRARFDHAALRDMLATARRHGIELYFFVPPDHARHCETRRLVGVEPLFRQWLREVAEVLAAEAGPAGRRFALWDFSGYNGVTTETVPAAPGRMIWYNDSVHFTYRAGRAATDRMLGFADRELDGIDDFGEPITVESMEAHFARQDQTRARVLSHHPELVADVERLFRRP